MISDADLYWKKPSSFAVLRKFCKTSSDILIVIGAFGILNSTWHGLASISWKYDFVRKIYLRNTTC